MIMCHILAFPFSVSGLFSNIFFQYFLLFSEFSPVLYCICVFFSVFLGCSTFSMFFFYSFSILSVFAVKSEKVNKVFLNKLKQ